MQAMSRSSTEVARRCGPTQNCSGVMPAFLRGRISAACCSWDQITRSVPPRG
jgi:hypothetical protein